MNCIFEAPVGTGLIVGELARTGLRMDHPMRDRYTLHMQNYLAREANG